MPLVLTSSVVKVAVIHSLKEIVDIKKGTSTYACIATCCSLSNLFSAKKSFHYN